MVGIVSRPAVGCGMCCHSVHVTSMAASSGTLVVDTQQQRAAALCDMAWHSVAHHRSVPLPLQHRADAAWLAG